MTEQAVTYQRNRSWKAKLEFYLTLTESLFATAGLALLLLLSLAEIGARNFFHTAIPGSDVLIRYLVLWISFLGAVLAVRERHIKIDAIAVWLPEIWRQKLERPIFIFSAVVCGGLFWAGVRFWHEEWTNAAVDEKWVAALGLIIPLSFFLLALHFLIRFLIGPRSSKRAP